MSEPLILGIETSCDETSAAVLRGERDLLGHVIFTQDIHTLYGGVVPELASRAHLRTVDDVVEGALREAGVTLADIDVVGVTAGPGLIGALLVGVSWGKAAAFAAGKPVVGVHHMEGHLFATHLEHPGAEPPFVGLLVSGGHTMLLWVPAWGEYRLLGATRDDAAGEAFDKAAKILGLGYPGGPSIQRAATEGDPARHPLPRPLLNRGERPGDREYYDMSFSGLKNALRLLARDLESKGTLAEETPHVAASFQAAAVDVLTAKTMRAVREMNCPRVVLGGGVANSRALREALARKLGSRGELYAPSPRLSTDNAAMIARAALFRWRRGETGGLDLNARADLPFPGLTR
ncbi:tRNA (adenosine(37)-N6)-threonylcarbamoyltransferase complex transferase subunit TsaD [Longimicrobium terrae]|uniref:tRNA N6-adenosine threonylcarbamoyltransferase n=1 Tax=Longimicrobium terrae TaxID=1639882 RepID=A0A841H382_9BACT|nr:N6-L-threonylcarbamoyladenine synthase [Longimicrobium terrae]MBB6072428.1 N6-L-threonylcarbamoyladenine synthase [Longimicrobium terrae]NNC32158.1 tRNA (adenosine(37)-N6)-threonylcarbamoyltransferase complex transferase subunit TsaD [Longimicrobium terrae]